MVPIMTQHVRNSLLMDTTPGSAAHVLPNLDLTSTLTLSLTLTLTVSSVPGADVTDVLRRGSPVRARCVARRRRRVWAFATACC